MGLYPLQVEELDPSPLSHHPGRGWRRKSEKKMTVTDPSEERGARRPQVVILV